MSCSCDRKPWNEPGTGTSDSSTPSTCVLCSEDKDKRVKSKSDFNKYLTSVSDSKSVDLSKTIEVTKSVASKDINNKKLDVKLGKNNDSDETDRLIHLRNLDYMDIVDDKLKIVVALPEYPESKMQLKEMQQFQKTLNDVMDMQLKAGLLKKSPSFIDYYLNRGAIVCICKDSDSRDWVVRIFPGIQERMGVNLVLFKAKIKRLYLGVIKTPKSCWPDTAQDAFKLLQYFNPTLNIHLWKIYSQEIIDDVEITSFMIDKVSGEFIRGSSFKNVIDYNQIEFELTGNTEIYYDSYLSDRDEDLSSIASRVKLLQEIKSNETTPRNEPESNDLKISNLDKDIQKREQSFEIKQITDDIEKGFEELLDVTVTKYSSDDDSSDNEEDICTEETNVKRNDSHDIEFMDASTSTVAISEKTESVSESIENFAIRNNLLNIDSNRGISYHRRTNYLHVENELKTSIVLEGYPQDKLDGTHIRRLKHLFKEYLHKDMKSHRFGNMIIPKFQDVYLSNGAVIYICDSLETRDYLTELLPKFINATGLKLNFKSVTDLVRYTRIIMKLPQEISNVESHDILYALRVKYPKLNPDCWKYYSDVAGKQKRQFGVDPQSLEVIKCPNFDPIYEGNEINFRIIDRQKRDEEISALKDNGSEDVQKLREKLLKTMYCPIDSDVMNAPLTRIRTKHYSDLIADDLKLFLGPVNYPETRIDEVEFHSIKNKIENIVLESYENSKSIPKFHDLYLFDGVIFVICQDMTSRIWLEENISNINSKIEINLKGTEFRGAVGIVSMIARTNKDIEEVIAILQKQNARLRTKFWRIISTVRTRTKLDVVLLIDKLSAQIISEKAFNGMIGENNVEFILGHLQSLLKPNLSSRELIKEKADYVKKTPGSPIQAPDNILTEKINPNLRDETINILQEKVNSTFCNKENDENSLKSIKDLGVRESCVFIFNDIDTKSDRSSLKSFNKDQGFCKMVLKVPKNILPESKDGLDVIFDLLEDKNPGLNTEMWKVERKSYSRGQFSILIDEQSAFIIKSKGFDPTLGGEKLKFIL